VSNVTLVGVHVGQRDRFRIASEDLLGSLASLGANRFITLGVALAGNTLSTLASASTVITSASITIPTPTTSATVFVAIATSVSSLYPIGRLDIETDFALTEVSLNKAAQEQLESLDVPAFTADQKAGVGREHRDLDVLADHARLHLRFSTEQTKRLAHPLSGTVSGLAALLQCLDFFGGTETGLNKNGPGALSEMLTNERPGEFFEGISPQLLCCALKRLTEGRAFTGN